MLVEDDPCLASEMTESILPLIPDRGNNNKYNNHQGQQVDRLFFVERLSENDLKKNLRNFAKYFLVITITIYTLVATTTTYNNT